MSKNADLMSKLASQSGSTILHTRKPKQPCNLTFTVTHTLKLHSQGDVLWTSAKALAPASPIAFCSRSMRVNVALAFKASDTMAQNVYDIHPVSKYVN